jgi:glycyl-tRNA synthetase
MQDAIRILTDYWANLGCAIAEPFNTEVGAGTMNPATILRVLGPEPWRVAYVEPSVRPDDSRYGENPNRLQTHTQFQVVIKPEPGNPQDLYLGSLEAIGIDLRAHDVRFVEDNWQQPAIGAWGLGWEVWLDGLEISQYTYFQQVGGLNLDPVSLELTYGLERILMSLQGVTNFKDIAYAPGLTYGEVFGQQEYEMSRYYLDDADIETNRTLYDLYIGEATRLIEAGLPLPAHTYVLKSSHAFNVLDARGAISTTERAKAFGTMRRLSRELSRLWVAKRESLDFPLLKKTAEPSAPVAPAEPATAAPQTGIPQTGASHNAVFEIGTEELPPHVVLATIETVRAAVTDRLAATSLPHGPVSVDGTPRRIVVRVADVGAAEPDSTQVRKGPRWSAAFDQAGQPTKALLGFLRAQQASQDDVVRMTVDQTEYASVEVPRTGRSAVAVLTDMFSEIVTGLRADKNMRWSDPKLSFSRPIRWLLGLWGSQLLPVRASELTAGRTTWVLRSDEQPSVVVSEADAYEQTVARHGILLSFRDRRERIVTAAVALAAGVDGVIDLDNEADLLDEIANLVEYPTVIRGSFERRYLELPEEVLATVMRKHQRYLPARTAEGRLLPYFITVANGAVDEATVREGNESVLRARYEDAAFFFAADLQVPPEDFHRRLGKLTFEDKLGSVAERAARINEVAQVFAKHVALDEPATLALRRAGELAKFDLATQMVVEMSSLAGYMAREYALRSGEPAAVADALAEMEQPRTTNAPLPATPPGVLLALADRFDLLMGMFALGTKPTGSSDPFGLRRAALGVIRILRNSPAMAPITVDMGLEVAATVLREQGVTVTESAIAEAVDFTLGRLAQQLRDDGVPPSLTAAIMPAATAPGEAVAHLADVQQLLEDSTFRDLVTVLQRIDRIMPEGASADYDPALLTEPAEIAVLAAKQRVEGQHPETLVSFTRSSASLVKALNAFFDEILVMADDPGLRAARIGLLASVRELAPGYLDWSALHTALAEDKGSGD